MTRTRIIFLLIAALILATGISLLIIFYPQEEKIKKQLKLLCKLVSKEPGEKNLKMIYKIQTIPSLFYSECDIELLKNSWNGSYTPEEISSHIARARTQFRILQLSIYDIKIEKIDQNTARAVFTAKLKAQSDSNSIDEVCELESILLLHEGKWLFSSFKTIDILEK